jgi:hypothetical protein
MRTGYAWGICLALLAGCGDRSPDAGLATAPAPSSQVADAGAPEHLADLVRAAGEAEFAKDFVEAARIRREIREVLVAEHGAGHWIVANCELAIAGDERLASLDEKSRLVLAQLRELERQTGGFMQAGALRRAQQCIDQAKPLAANVFGGQSPLALRLHLMAGNVAQQLWQWEAAGREFEQAAQLAAELFPMPHPDRENALYQRGMVERQLGNFGRSSELIAEARQLNELLTGRKAAFAQRTYELGVSRHREGKLDEALRELMLAQQIRSREFGPSHPLVAECLVAQAVVLIDQQQPSEARNQLAAAMSICESKPHAADLMQEARLQFATACTLEQDFAAAATQLQAALETSERRAGRWSPQYAQLAYRLGMSWAFQANYAKAEPLFRHALSVQNSLLGKEHEQTKKTEHALAELLRQARREEAGETLR